jgi:hypothetical protein
LTGAGGPAAIGVARSLAHHDLVGMDRDKYALTIEFFARLGLNFPDLYVRCATGEKIPPQPKIADGWLWVRSMDSLPVLIHESALA